jgi:hypothetical protein
MVGAFTDGERLVSDRHPIVGSWRVSVEIPGVPAGLVNLATFSLDGGVLVAVPSPAPAPPGSNHRLEFWTTAIGRWAPTGDRSAVTTFVTLGADENGAPVGSHTVSATLTAEADGQGLSGPFQIAIAGPDDKPVATLAGTVRATRITAEAASM